MEITIKEAWERYSNVLWDSGVYKSTAHSFICEISFILQSSDCNVVDERAIDVLIAELRKKGNKNSTINRKLAVLYKLLRKAHSMGTLKKIPVYLRLRERNARVRFLTDDEESALFSAISTRNIDNLRLCEFLVDTGARIGEALNLKWCDVSTENATFWITKSGKSRTVPLTKRASEAVYSCGKARNSGPFSMINYQQFRYDWNAAKKSAGLSADSQVVPHILRHTCASRLVQAGIDLRRVQSFLGHQTIQMTLRYAHLSTADLDQCARALEARSQ